MKKESIAILLRMYIGEQDKYEGKTLYHYIVEYLRKNHFAGVTVLRGIEGFGLASKIHSANILDLSTDEPIIIEIVDTQEKIEAFKKAYETWQISGSALITEEQVKIVQYGHHPNGNSENS
jgi:PII-like signaling protein